MDWRHFRFDWRLRAEALWEVLIDIEAHRRAASLLTLPPDWRRELDRLNRVRAIHGTTALEGNPLTEAEVRQQLDLAAAETAEGRPDRPPEHREVRNAGRAQDWVKERFSADSNPPLRREELLRMHALLTEGSDERRTAPGRLRTDEVTVGTVRLGGIHRGAPAPDLGRLMDEFVALMNSRRFRSEHAAIQALLAHFFLVTIHPFGGGNGRTSRLVEAAVLYRGRYNIHGFYGLSNYFYRNGDDYRLLLQRSRRSQPFDLQEFVAFGLRGFASELEGINDFIQMKTNRAFYRNVLDRARRQREGKRRRVLNDREYDLLEILLEQTEPVDPFAEESSRHFSLLDLIRNRSVRTLYGSVTDRTFRRELTRLASRGFLRFEPRDGDWFVELDFGAIARY